jgi:hypothetical protein
MQAAHRVKSKVGENEFEAEGDRQWVDKKWEEFKAMVEGTPAGPASKHRETANMARQKRGAAPGRTKLSQSVLDAVFRKGDPLSLTDRPKSENGNADALLMLVYGHTEMLGEPEVTAAALAKSARQTGVSVDRIGRVIGAYGDLIKVSGVKKGTRYSLNNRGIAEAEKLISAMAK